MALSDQDREWVRAIIQEAALQTLDKARDQAERCVARHAQSCSFILQSRALIVGICLGAGLAGSGLTVVVQRLLLRT